MDAYQLQTLTCYSFGQSSVKCGEYLGALDKYDYQGGGICDMNMLSSFPSFAKELSAHQDFEPAYGMIINITLGELIFKAELVILDEEGYESLVSLFNLHQEAYSLNDLQSCAEGLACILKTEGREMKDSGFLEAHSDFFYKLSSLYKVFFFGLEIYTSGDASDIKNTVSFASSHSYDYLAFPKVCYLNREDSFKTQVMLKALFESKTLKEEELDGSNAPFFILTPHVMETVYGSQAVLNQGKLIKLIHFDFFKKRGGILSFNGKEEDGKKLRELAYNGLKRKFGEHPDSKYLTRLEYELGIIAQMGFSSYFLIVEDCVGAAKKAGIYVGPGRGSACSSLTAYLLDITAIDPLRFNLSFERFLNPLRKNPPDIDVDFEAERRNQVVDYLFKTYGEDRVSLIVTYNTLQLRSSLDAVRKIFAYPEERIKSLSSLVKGKDGDFTKEVNDNYKFKKAISDPYFKDIVYKANLLLSYPISTSVHPSGVIVSDAPLKDLLPCFKGDRPIAGFEFTDLETMGFLKLDILSLSNLSFIHKIEDNIRKMNLEYVSPYSNLNDMRTYEVLNHLQVLDIFQLDHKDMEEAIREIHPDSFNDIIALLALNRPGPKDSIPAYGARKNRGVKYVLPCKELYPILSPTYGILVYQEQILEICQKIAGFNGGEADLFRRAVSKKDASVMNKMKDKFIQGVKDKGLSQKEGEDIFALIAKFASFGFNKAHATAYAYISYALLFYKAHYPAAFFLASLEGQSFFGEENSATRRRLDHLYMELYAFSFQIVRPDVNASQEDVTCISPSFIIGLNQIAGLNKKLAEDIVRRRKEGGKYVSISDFFCRNSFLNSPDRDQGEISLRDVNPGLFPLIASGALDGFGYDRKDILNNILGLISLRRFVDKDKTSNIDMYMPDIAKKPLTIDTEGFISEYQALGLVLSARLSDLIAGPRKYPKLYLLTEEPRYVSKISKTVVKAIDEKQSKTLFLPSGEEVHKYDIISASEDMYSRFRDISRWAKEAKK